MWQSHVPPLLIRPKDMFKANEVVVFCDDLSQFDHLVEKEPAKAEDHCGMFEHPYQGY